MKCRFVDVFSTANSKIKLSLAAFLTTLAISGCGPLKQPEPVSKLQIVNGTKVANTDSSVLRMSTVALTSDFGMQAPFLPAQPSDFRGGNGLLPVPLDVGNSFCTATIIAENALVTDAHCVQKYNPKLKSGAALYPDDTDFLAYFGNAVQGDGTWIRAKKVTVHPDWHPELGLERHLASNDVGLILLSQKIPAGYAPVKIAGLGSPSQNDRLYLAGFGLTGSGFHDAGILRQVEIKIASLDPEAHRFSISSGWNQGATLGDVGGPAYAANNQGEWNLTGVATWNHRYGGIINSYTDLRYYTQWIAEEIAKN